MPPARARPRPAPVQPRSTLAEFSARRLDSLPACRAATLGWDRSQWFAAALALNPQLAEERAEVATIAAAERTAASVPTPPWNCSGNTSKPRPSPAWLYGVSLDFLLRRPGERDRAREQAALQTALAKSQLSESIWEVRAALRLALLDVVAAQDEAAQLKSLAADRAALLETSRVRLQLGDMARAEMLTDELELGRAQQAARRAGPGTQRRGACAPGGRGGRARDRARRGADPLGRLAGD